MTDTRCTLAQTATPETSTEAAPITKFQIGDVVQFNSGGIRMTVINNRACGPFPSVECIVGQFLAGLDDFYSTTLDERCLKLARTDICDEVPF